MLHFFCLYDFVENDTHLISKRSPENVDQNPEMWINSRKCGSIPENVDKLSKRSCKRFDTDKETC